MMNRQYQGRNIGSAIIGETADRLREMGKTAIRLGIDKENPQSVHFWKKNGFAVIREADMGGLFGSGVTNRKAVRTNYWT